MMKIIGEPGRKVRNLAAIMGSCFDDITPRGSNTDIEVLREVERHFMAFVPYDPQDYRR